VNSASWLQEIGDLTREHRERRARTLSKRGELRKWELRSQLWSEVRVRDALRWYESRARGQRERVARVSECGAEVLQLTCTACRKMHERPTGCRVGILCVKCRGRIAQIKRAVFSRARAHVLLHASRRGLLFPLRPKGPFGEKFLTLTAPHILGDSIARRIERVLNAWPSFLKQMNTYFRERAIKSAEWFRVFEWTPGGDQLGHPHVHVWLFCPFLPRQLLREWWRLALASAGCQLKADDPLVVDIRKIVDADGGARELIKYLTKDITSDGHKLDARLYAEVYKALDGRRVTQASKGFMARAESEARRCECGTDLPLSVRRVRAEAATRSENHGQ